MKNILLEFTQFFLWIGYGLLAVLLCTEGSYYSIFFIIGFPIVFSFVIFMEAMKKC